MIFDPYHPPAAPVQPVAQPADPRPTIDLSKAKEAAGKVVGNLARALSLIKLSGK